MADFKELQDRLASLRDKVQADNDEDRAVVARLKAKIADLQAQVDANQPVDLQPLLDEVTAIESSISTETE